MRTLPDSPSVAYLRRQAKDLLVGLRESHADTSLASAQAKLARQYGFASWADLRTEAERRRGRTQVADPSLAQAIVDRFGLGRIVAPMRSLSAPNEIGRPWALETDSGRWAVKELNDWFDASNAETDVRLQEAALAAGVTLPRPLRSAEGRIVERIEDRNWRVNAWIESGPPLSAPASGPLARKAGAVLAKLHGLALSADRPMDRWYRPLRGEDEWSVLAERAEAAGASWTSMLQRLLPSLLELQRIACAAVPPQTMLCYCGCGPGNSRLLRDGRLALVGWEHAGAFPPSWELANAVLAWSVGPHGDPPNLVSAHALLDAYTTECGVRPAFNLSCFSAHISAWINYAYGQILSALPEVDANEDGSTDRAVSHLLENAPTRAQYEALLSEL